MISAQSLTTLRKTFETHHDLSDEDWAVLSPLLSEVHLERGACFLRAGETSRWLGFVVSGLLRAYYTTPEGTEVVTNFCAESSFVCAYPAALTDTPARATFEALEATHLLRLDVGAFRSLFQSHAAWNHIGRSLAETYFVIQERRIADLLMLDAAGRLARFRETHAALLPRLQQQQVASYLGITRESLSRLRASRSLNKG